jgi:hypothetical protein
MHLQVTILMLIVCKWSNLINCKSGLAVYKRRQSLPTKAGDPELRFLLPIALQMQHSLRHPRIQRSSVVRSLELSNRFYPVTSFSKLI